MAVVDSGATPAAGITVLVCGSRTWTNDVAVFNALDEIHERTRIVRVINGGASGADRFAASWAEMHARESVTVYPDWDRHGRAAGPLRNAMMLSFGPSLVLAFRRSGKSSGTDDMIRKAKAAGVPTRVWRETPAGVVEDGG